MRFDPGNPQSGPVRPQKASPDAAIKSTRPSPSSLFRQGNLIARASSGTAKTRQERSPGSSRRNYRPKPPTAPERCSEVEEVGAERNQKQNPYSCRRSCIDSSRPDGARPWSGRWTTCSRSAGGGTSWTQLGRGEREYALSSPATMRREWRTAVDDSRAMPRPRPRNAAPFTPHRGFQTWWSRHDQQACVAGRSPSTRSSRRSVDYVLSTRRSWASRVKTSSRRDVGL